ncbi:putative SAP domain, Rho termination factor [Rosa chinensis]|uniref:Putative SAP domain, Rho termination factor n=1 Tax=Rosa chinensis TaxID=74649 RepID=A0A2P6PV83_ROSCH|nr:rho-N domain-containing protein 1, chloroplastic [Rosa chinensis]PRQ25834.1 putative SAP domain, Rho termination factor [Rosa chinensis]
MSQSVHLICSGPSDSKCLPCSGISGRVAPVYPCSSRFNHRFKSQVRVGSLRGAYTGVSFTCRAGSSGRNRNPDFPRQNRQGYSRGRNRRNEERDSFENLEESDLLSAKNGPLLSLPSNTKFGATAAPGPREKEIVELFRKVQAQLRERTAVKEEKKVEPVQGQGKDNGTVDSLLKLLRKHSAEQAKRNSNGVGNKDFMLDQPEKTGRYSERKNTASLDSINSVKDYAEEPTASLSRPASNFRRKSPINRLTYQPIYSEDDEIVNSVQHVNSTDKRKKNYAERVSEPEPEPEPELEIDVESVLEPEPVHHTEFGFEPEAEPVHDTEFGFEPEPEPEPEQEIVQLLEDETSGTEVNVDDDDVDEDKEQLIEQTDLSACKLPELRALAKSRGVKGFSKMKKAELLELLTGGSLD